MSEIMEEKTGLNQLIVTKYHQAGQAKLNELAEIFSEVLKILVVKLRDETGSNETTQIKRLMEYYFAKLHQAITPSKQDFIKQGETESEMSEQQSSADLRQADKADAGIDYTQLQNVLKKPKTDTNQDLTSGVGRTRLRFDPELNAFQLEQLKISSQSDTIFTTCAAKLSNGNHLVVDWKGKVYDLKEGGQTDYKAPDLKFSKENSKDDPLKASYLRPCSTGCLVLEKNRVLTFIQPKKNLTTNGFNAVEVFSSTGNCQVLKFYSVHVASGELDGKDKIHIFALTKESPNSSNPGKFYIKHRVLEKDSHAFLYKLKIENEMETKPFEIGNSNKEIKPSNVQFMHYSDKGTINVALAIHDGTNINVYDCTTEKPGFSREINSFQNKSEIVSSHYLEELKRWVIITRLPPTQDAQNMFEFIELNVANGFKHSQGPNCYFEGAYKSTVKTGGISAVHLFEEKKDGQSADYTRKFFIFTESGFYASGSYDGSKVGLAPGDKTNAIIKPNTNHELTQHHQISDSYVNEGVFHALFAPRPTNQTTADHQKREALIHSIQLSYKFGKDVEDN